LFGFRTYDRVRKKKTVDYFSNKENAYVILLTKSNLVQPLLDLNHNQHTIVQWSMNNEEFIKLYEHGTASMISRLKAAKFVQEAGYPVTFRVDPIFATKGWKQHYSKMIEKIYEYIKPDHITFAVAKFQGPEEIKQIIANSYGHDSKLLNQELGKFEFAKANYSSDYLKSENSFPGTMPDMPFTYPDQLRYELLSHMIKTTRKYDFDLRIGVCEESADMWGELGLPYSNNKNLDCACNYTGFAT
jgi:spore photoproduct lyase